MLFNSFAFCAFFPLVTALYFLIPHRGRWAFLLGASYFFYAWWEPAYLVLIFASTLIDYGAGRAMGRRTEKRARRKYLILSLAGNLGMLGTFKYFNFFNESLRTLCGWVSLGYDVPALDVLLPVGISFYTFQSLSYTIDVYRGDRDPERHLGVFALYVSFFPQLVAGPIERSTHLIPQFYERHRFQFDDLAAGARLMLWGFFLKIAVADRLAVYVDAVYSDIQSFQGVTLLIATYFFAFQIFADFAGYSYIAIGAARIMGFSLMENFRRPYFAPSPSRFWGEWHISLSTWFRDYVYIPLGGNRVPRYRFYLNVLAVFLVSGLWHGAHWNMVIWGAFHGAIVIIQVATFPMRDRLALATGYARMPRVQHLVQLTVTFYLIAAGWVFFRSASLGEALLIFKRMATGLFTDNHVYVATGTPTTFLISLALVAFVLMVQGAQGDRSMGEFFQAMRRPTRWIVYYALVFGTLLFGNFEGSQFIYFQF
jgi:D-alanyl-lipoteichoic acid acyltransferase DltB (MBOAT superfamily)